MKTLKDYIVQMRISGLDPKLAGEKALQKKFKSMLNDLGYLVEYIDVIERGAPDHRNVLPFKKKP